MRSDYQIGEFIFLYSCTQFIYFLKNQIILQSRFVQLSNHLTDVNLWGDERDDREKGKAKERHS